MEVEPECDSMGNVTISKESLLKEMMGYKDHNPDTSVYALKITIPETVNTDC